MWYPDIYHQSSHYKLTQLSQTCIRIHVDLDLFWNTMFMKNLFTFMTSKFEILLSCVKIKPKFRIYILEQQGMPLDQDPLFCERSWWFMLRNDSRYSKQIRIKLTLFSFFSLGFGSSHYKQLKYIKCVYLLSISCCSHEFIQ